MRSFVGIASIAVALLALTVAGTLTGAFAQGTQVVGTYEGNVARRLVRGETRETRIYRLTMNDDQNTGKVWVFELEGRKLRNEMGFVVRRMADLTYEGETRPIKTTPGYIPDKIKLTFARDGRSVTWYHNDGTTEGSGTLQRAP